MLIPVDEGEDFVIAEETEEEASEPSVSLQTENLVSEETEEPSSSTNSAPSAPDRRYQAQLEHTFELLQSPGRNEIPTDNETSLEENKGKLPPGGLPNQDPPEEVQLPPSAPTPGIQAKPGRDTPSPREVLPTAENQVLINQEHIAAISQSGASGKKRKAVLSATILWSVQPTQVLSNMTSTTGTTSGTTVPGPPAPNLTIHHTTNMPQLDLHYDGNSEFTGFVSKFESFAMLSGWDPTLWHARHAWIRNFFRGAAEVWHDGLPPAIQADYQQTIATGKLRFPSNRERITTALPQLKKAKEETMDDFIRRMNSDPSSLEATYQRARKAEEVMEPQMHQYEIFKTFSAGGQSPQPSYGNYQNPYFVGPDGRMMTMGFNGHPVIQPAPTGYEPPFGGYPTGPQPITTSGYVTPAAGYATATPSHIPGSSAPGYPPGYQVTLPTTVAAQNQKHIFVVIHERNILKYYVDRGAAPDPAQGALRKCYAALLRTPLLALYRGSAPNPAKGAAAP
ncbi:hypothetical protein R1sor_025390 [Riccia sorocarpa]|uniref:Retrotransposon gag domain-containing protein n=1 Tax=Riccia sorocarpa TaxID=122646 RepID=A0ABD3GB89_9MARC